MVRNSIDPEVRRFLEDPEREIKQAYAQKEQFLLKYLAHSLRRIDSNPAEGRRLALVAQRVIMPRITHQPCLTVQVVALLAMAEKFLGHLDRADTLLDLAFDLAGDCQKCHAHLHRRRGLIRKDQKRFDEALSSSDTALEFYQVIETDEVHELYGHGLATAHLWRGIVYYHSALNDRREKAPLISCAVSDYGKSLSLISARRHPFLYRAAIVNLAAAISETGEEEHLKLADRQLREARRLFHGVSEISQERANLDWTTAMIRHELGSMRPSRVEYYLERSQLAFIHLGMRQQAIAVSADRCRLVFPDQNRIRELITEVDGILTRISSDLRQKLQAVIDATNIEGWDAPGILRHSIETLRQGCGSDMLACLLSWPASI